jgi:hypothetical protein
LPIILSSLIDIIYFRLASKRRHNLPGIVLVFLFKLGFGGHVPIFSFLKYRFLSPFLGLVQILEQKVHGFIPILALPQRSSLEGGKLGASTCLDGGKRLAFLARWEDAVKLIGATFGG